MERKRYEVEFVVITPERQVLFGRTGSLVIPAHDGELGILPHRAPLMCELGIGELRYHKDNRLRRVFIDGGFAQVLEDRVTVLTPQALAGEDITDATIAAAKSDLSDATSADDRARAKRRVAVMRSVRAAS